MISFVSNVKNKRWEHTSCIANGVIHHRILFHCVAQSFHHTVSETDLRSINIPRSRHSKHIFCGQVQTTRTAWAALRLKESEHQKGLRGDTQKINEGMQQPTRKPERASVKQDLRAQPAQFDNKQNRQNDQRRVDLFGAAAQQFHHGPGDESEGNTVGN